MRYVVANINLIVAQAPSSVMLLVENTAGMGTEVGYRFDQLAEILDSVDCPDRVGVVLDTAHLFAAGYGLGSRSEVDRVVREFDSTVGLGRLYLLHLNDSKSERGSRLDRHWHIGQGRIGLEGFRAIVNHPLLRHMPAVLETPRKSSADDRANLLQIRRLLN
jgi:deoxyribonuclease-4